MVMYCPRDDSVCIGVVYFEVPVGVWLVCRSNGGSDVVVAVKKGK